MAETYPFHYQFPYVISTQCGGRNSCYGRHCLQPGSEYIERAAFNRFEPPPPLLPSTSCVRPPPQTCNGVGDIFYQKGEYVAPQALQTVSQCSLVQPASAFSVSRVRYPTL